MSSFNLLSASTGLLLGLFFDPENENNMFLRNFRISSKYTESQSEEPYSSQKFTVFTSN
jgi:hypothetical protein